MEAIDPVVSTLRSALRQRREIDFKIGGAPVTMRPHVLYIDKSRALMVAGTVGSIPIVRVPVGQINDLIVSPRYFQPDTTFDFGDPEYDSPATVLARV
jgi:hypothetical protein